MYKAAEKVITRGMGLVPRLILAAFSGLFATVMFLVAPPTDKAVYFYMFGGFCALISLACLTSGKVRQFLGSFIGISLFILSLLYVGAQFEEGPLYSLSRGEPSLLNSLLFLVFFGFPGLMYAINARFGISREDKLSP